MSHLRPGRLATLADLAPALTKVRAPEPHEPAISGRAHGRARRLAHDAIAQNQPWNCPWCGHPNSTLINRCTKCDREFD